MKNFIMTFVFICLLGEKVSLAKETFHEDKSKQTSKISSLKNEARCDTPSCKKDHDPGIIETAKKVTIVSTIIATTGYILWKIKKWVSGLRLKKPPQTPLSQIKTMDHSKQDPKSKPPTYKAAPSSSCNGFSCTGPSLLLPLGQRADQALAAEAERQLKTTLENNDDEIFAFTIEELDALNHAADEVEALTTEEDQLLFLGRSPLWIAETMRLKKKRRHQAQVAFSGSPYTAEDPQRRPSQEQILAFRAYLL